MNNNSIIFFHPSSELYGSDKILVYVMKTFSDYKKTLILCEEGPLIELVKNECTDVMIHILPTLPIIRKKNFKPNGIIKFIFTLVVFRKDINRLIKEKPSIIYLNTLATLPVLFYYRNIMKIIHVHEILKNNSLLHKTINRVAIRKSDALICVSNAVRDNLIEVANTEISGKIKVVYNGINFKKEEMDDNNILLNTDNRILNFALIGRIKPSHKGQCLLLDAIAKLSSEHLSQCHFYFVGSPVPGQEYMQDEVITKIHTLNLGTKVTIIPFIKKIEQIYEQTDVVIVPSTFDDPFPTTVLEAMFFNKPVIGTRVGGIPEMIIDAETGFLVNRDDVSDLSMKIAYFIDNRDIIQEMGEKGRIFFEKNFSEESFVYRYKDTINDIL